MSAITRRGLVASAAACANVIAATVPRAKAVSAAAACAKVVFAAARDAFVRVDDLGCCRVSAYDASAYFGTAQPSRALRFLAQGSFARGCAAQALLARPASVSTRGALRFARCQGSGIHFRGRVAQ